MYNNVKKTWITVQDFEGDFLVKIEVSYLYKQKPAKVFSLAKAKGNPKNLFFSFRRMDLCTRLPL